MQSSQDVYAYSGKVDTKLCFTIMGELPDAHKTINIYAAVFASSVFDHDISAEIEQSSRHMICAISVIMPGQ